MMTRSKLKTTALLTLAAVFVVLQSPAQAFAKKNICTVAINSNDEINMYKKYLPASDFNFIELVPDERLDLLTSPEKWFFDACDKKISCDTLIVSAHFAGTFFGLQKSYRISLETLEQASCSNRCEGILRNPKEVWLYGCNTLAGKDSDGRTPEEYRSDLINEYHMPPEYVEQMVAFKRSPLGVSYGDRIRRVFNNVPFIYGFDSKAPLGSEIAGPLSQYLKPAGIAAGRRYLQIWSSDDPKRHQPLLDLVNQIPGKKFIQEAGLTLKPGEKIPACLLNDPQMSVTDKLNWIDSALKTDKRLEYIPDVGDYLTKQKNYQWSSQQTSILEDISENKDAQNSVTALLQAPMNGFLGVQVKTLNLARQIGWVSEPDFQTLLHNLVIGDLKKPITSNRLDAVCSLNLIVAPTLTMNEIPDSAWKQPNFISMVGCLSVQDLNIRNQVLTLSLQSRGDSQTAATGTLAKMPGLTADQILSLVPLLDDTGSDSDVRVNVLKVIARLTSAPDDLKQKLFDVFIKDPSTDVAQQAADTMVKINIGADQNVVQQIENTAAHQTRDPMRTAYALRTLKKLPEPGQYVEYYVRAFDSQDTSIQSEALQAASTCGVDDLDLQRAVLNKFRSTADFRVMLSAFTALGSLPLQKYPEILSGLVSVIEREEVSGDVDKKASFATTLLFSKTLTPPMTDALKTQWENEKNPEVKWRLGKLLKIADSN